MHVPGSLKRLTEQRKCKIFVGKLNDMFNLQKSRQNAMTASSLINNNFPLYKLYTFKIIYMNGLLYFNIF